MIVAEVERAIGRGEKTDPLLKTSGFIHLVLYPVWHRTKSLQTEFQIGARHDRVGDQQDRNHPVLGDQPPRGVPSAGQAVGILVHQAQ